MITRLLEQPDCAAIARLHLDALPTSFSGQAGVKLLALYYRVVAAEQGAVGYVAEDDQVGIKGFVCGVWNSEQLRRYLFRRYGLLLLLWGGIQLLQKPQFLISLFDRFRPMSERSMAAELVRQSGYELRPIVVGEAARGSGAAVLLVESLLRDAQRRGYNEIYLYVEPNNLAARRLYAKIGFVEEHQEERSGQSVIYCRYRMQPQK